MSHGVKKSLYVFLASLLGVMLFLTLHRVAVFMYLVLLSLDYKYFDLGLTFIQFLALDYFTLVITLLLGSWYGIWIGQYWFEKVYEEKSHSGLVGHLAGKLWPVALKTANMESKLTMAKKHIEENILDLENIAKTLPTIIKVQTPIKRRVVRKKYNTKI